MNATNYFSMSIFNGQGHCRGVHFVSRYQFSLGPGSAVGKKDKKIAERSELRGSLKRGKGGAALSPFPGYRPARFIHLYFFYLIPFFPFFPNCGAWSQANDSYAMKLEKSSLNDKITSFISPTHHINCCFEKLMNFEKLLGKQVFKNHNYNPFQSVCTSLLPFAFAVSFILFSNNPF